MQAVSIHSLSSPPLSRYESIEISAKISEDFSRKLRIEDSNGGFVDSEEMALEVKEDKKIIKDKEEEEEEDEDEEEEEEEEFSFACINPDGSPICADDVFQNGEIRPVFPIFNRDLLFADAYDGGDSSSRKEAAESSWPPLKKLFIEEQYGNSNTTSSSCSTASESDELESIPEGTYCEWSGKNTSGAAGSCKKSNSTGFSRLWRFRDLVHRSYSDGKDAFVFLNPNSATRARPTSVNIETVNKTETAEKKEEEEEKKTISSGTAATATATAVKRKANRKGKTASSVHEKHYVRNRAKKEEDKRRSYLPYRQDLVGFFTNVNAMSRNVHPF